MKPVPPRGDPDAPLLIVGEAGGKEEGLKGEPFVGVTGNKLRYRVKRAGLDWEHHVARANVIPFQMGELPKTIGGMQAVVRQHWNAITPVLAENHKVVLAVGRAALFRLTGLTGILAEHGGTWPVGYWPDLPNSILVATVHPASVMRTKIEAGWALVDAAVRRACEYALGMPYNHSVMSPNWAWVNHYELDAELSEASAVAIDTEFDVKTGKPFLIGLKIRSDYPVWSVRPDPDVIAVLRKHMTRDDLTKVFHHAPADITALSTIGVDVRFPIFDTLRAQARLNPDLPVGLAKTALLHFDHLRNWKGMPHNDPQYNAIDVDMTWRLYHVQQEQLALAGIDEVYWKEALPLSMCLMAMHARGMAVDRVEQAALNARYNNKKAALQAEIKEIAEGVFAKRREPMQARLDDANAKITALELTLATKPDPGCPDHPTYTGSRKPPKHRGCLLCDTLYASREVYREALAAARKARDVAEKKLAAWTPGSTVKVKRKGGFVFKDTGFDPGNNEHLRWLLYDKDGFNLPKQYKDGKVTANNDAVARLLGNAKVRAKGEAVLRLLVATKEYQHAGKMQSTFVNPDLDPSNIAHPEARDYGVGTGRLAGGASDDLADKANSKYSYSAMNIPQETRSIYVARPDWTKPVSLHITDKEGVDDGLYEGLEEQLPDSEGVAE